MKLPAYLAARGPESENAFARRARVAQAIINRVCNGKGCSPRNQRLIVEASRSQPAPCGGTVTYEDLIPERDGRSSSEPPVRPAKAAGGAR